MRLGHAAAAFLTLALAATSVRATITQPNGVIMPLDSANGEEQLYTLFAGLGEPIDWLSDGTTQPGAFSPLCDFSATLVLRETGSSLAVGWYNAIPNQPPAPDQIHEIVPVGSPVGTVITSADIKNDPAYAGGLIGFALTGWQTHYSEVSFDPICTGCNPPGPWVSAVIYPSKLTPNAYYIAFEDGEMGANPGDFNNDGDYNDYVYLLSGLTCLGGGQPCETGAAGICGPGVQQCTPAGLVCQGLSGAATETCNGLDDDCNGASDEGDICPSGYVCDKGTCVEACNEGEFQCPPDKVCSEEGYCVDPACAGVSCDPGLVCVDGTCKAPCDGVACPYPYVCRVGACVDPCSTVSCGANQVCDAGVCVSPCTCAPCGDGEACDEPSGLCIEPSCLGVPCDPGMHCVGGACVDSCSGAVCPPGQACEGGQCVPAPGGAGGAGGGTAETSITVGAGGDASSPSSTSAATGAGGAGTGGAAAADEDSGCGCRAVGGAPAGESGAWLLGAFALISAAAARRLRDG